MASNQIFVLLLAAVLCSNVMGKPCKKEDFPFFRQSRPTVGILRIRYFLFGDDSISQEELEIADLFKQEPTAGRDKVPPSGPCKLMRPLDEKGQPILKRPTDQPPMPPVPIANKPEAQIPNPQIQDKIPVNPPMVDPSKSDAPLPDESLNKLEQQKRKEDSINPVKLPAGQSPSQMNEPNPENMDRKEQLLDQFNPAKVLQQPSQPQQEFQQPKKEFQPERQQPLINQRRKRSPQRVRQLLPDYDDSFPHYGPGDDTQLYYEDPTLFQQRPGTFNTGLRMQDARPFYKPQRNDGGVDIELNV